MLLAYLPVLIFEAFVEMLSEPAPRPVAERADDREDRQRHRN